MRPYYEADGITIYHGDAREVLPSLEVPEIVLTDPPYGIGYASNRRPKHERLGGIEGDREFPAWLLDLSPSVALFVWCRWDVLGKMPPPKSLIAWDKGCHSMGDLEHEFGRQWEACAFYPGPEHRFIRRPVDVIRVPKVPPEKLRHPAEKPALVAEILLSSHAGNVLDPFMGIGGTLRAAKKLGRRATGIEIEERYCEIAAERLRQRSLF